MKWLIRAIVMVVAGAVSIRLAQTLIWLPPDASPADFQFSGLLIVGGNVLFAVLDFYFTQFDERAGQLASLAGAHTRLARELRQKTLASHRNISLVVTVATALKGIGAICGVLITQRALAPGHYAPARDLGFFTLGAAVPSVFILWRSVRKAEAVIEATTRYLEDERERKTHLDALRLGHVDESAES